VVAHIGDSLVTAMEMAMARGSAAAAQLVTCDGVAMAEIQDQWNWELIGHLAEHGQGEATGVLQTAFEAVEQEEDHHLYHTKEFTRELRIESLGLPAVLPPPPEITLEGGREHGRLLSGHIQRTWLKNSAELVERKGIEPSTFALRTRRSPS